MTSLSLSLWSRLALFSKVLTALQCRMLLAVTRAKAILRLRTATFVTWAPHIEDRRVRDRKGRPHRNPVSKADLSRILQGVDALNARAGAHINTGFPPEVWFQFQNGFILVLTKEQTGGFHRFQLVPKTLLEPGMTPGGEELSKANVHKWINKSNKRRPTEL